MCQVERFSLIEFNQKFDIAYPTDPHNLLADGLNSDSITNLKNPAPFGDDFGSEILYLFASDKYP